MTNYAAQDFLSLMLGLFLPFLSKLRPWTEVECIKWQASRLIKYLFIGVYFIPCGCSCDAIYDVQIKFGIRKKFRKEIVKP